MKVYVTDDKRENCHNKTSFRTEAIDVDTTDELLEIAASSDHTVHKFSNGYRRGANWESADTIMMDVDEGCTMDQFRELFGDFSFSVYTSRHHQMEKPQGVYKAPKPACDRFHVLFPLSHEYNNREEYEAMMKTLNRAYAFFDHNANDLARYFTMSGNDVLGYSNTGEYIDGFLKKLIERSKEAQNVDTPRIMEKDQTILLDLIRRLASDGEFRDYAAWISLGMALKSGGFGIEAWISLSDTGIPSSEFSSHWQSFDEGGAITYRSLIYWARLVDPTYRVASDDIPIGVDDDRHELPILNDADFSRRFLSVHGETIRYVKNLGWALYNGKNWELDVEKKSLYSLVTEVAKSTYNDEIASVTRMIHSEAIGIEEEKRLKERLKCLMSVRKHYGDTGGVNAAIEMVSGDPSVSVGYEAFNQKDMFTLGNGVYDLETGELLPHSPEYLSSNSSDFCFDESADCPQWRKFIRDVMSENEEQVRFVQKAVGYTLTNSVKEEKVFFCYGPMGANGKSTFFNVLFKLFGTSSATISASALMDSMGREAQEQFARLVHSRFVRTTELKKDAQFDEAVIKTISGKDEITCRALYHGSFSYYPKFKLWIFGNNKPKVDEIGNGFWRRIALISFDRVFAESEQIKDLDERLEKELPGIFNWALEGLRLYRAEGLSLTNAMQEEIMRYKLEENKVFSFMQDYTEVVSTYEREKEEMPFSTLYDAFKSYCDENKLAVISNKDFSKQLDALAKDLCIELRQGTGNRKVVVGRRLNCNC